MLLAISEKNLIFQLIGLDEALKRLNDIVVEAKKTARVEVDTPLTALVICHFNIDFRSLKSQKFYYIACVNQIN